MVKTIKRSALKREHYKRRKAPTERSAKRDEVEVPDYVVGGGKDVRNAK